MAGSASTDAHVEVVIGRIGRPHGVGGEVVVRVRTDEPDRRFVVGEVLVAERERDGSRRSLVLESIRAANDDLLVRFAGVDDRNAAEDIGGSLLMASVRADERPADDDEFYDHQLIGLAALATGGDPLGHVREVIHLPLQDVLAIVDPNGRELLVPFVAEIVTDVRPGFDGAVGTLTIELPDGFLDVAD